MAGSIGLNVGNLFAEMIWDQQGQPHLNRWYLPKKSLSQGIKETLEKNPDLKFQRAEITTLCAWQTIERREGTPIALLVTSGFENWPILRQRTQPEYFSVFPFRSEPLIAPELIFGISERINAQGEILTPLDLGELEFLCAKLELAQIKTIAVGFLHSQVNPTHETQAAAYLREKGFNVTLSHQVNKSSNEVARWWRTILNAYLINRFKEHHDEIMSALPKDTELFYQSSEGEFTIKASEFLLPSAFGHLRSLQRRHNLDPLNSSTEIVYCGLEKFWQISGPDQTIFHSFTGPIAVDHPKHTLLSIQPLCKLGNSLHSHLGEPPADKLKDAEPIILGKGFEPTFLDLLFYLEKLRPLAGIIENISDKQRFAIRDALHLLNSQRKTPLDTWSRNLFELTLDQLAIDITFNLGPQSKKVILDGPLASALLPGLEKRLKPHNLQLFSESNS